MANFIVPKLKAKVSTDCCGNLCADIVDKNNGNTTVACDVDENYELFILSAPDMYYALEECLGVVNHNGVKGLIIEALAKARGEYND